VRFGLWSGLLAGLCYFFRFLRPVLELPGPLGLVPWFLFGPFFALYAVGLYHYLRPRVDGPLVEAAALLTVASGAFVTAMFVVQSATFDVGFDFIRAAQDKASEATAYQIMNTVNVVQLGLGMCWDIFVSLGTALFAACFLRLGRWGQALGAVGGVVALGALGLNFATFPMPPAESGLIDLGPAIAAWYVAVAFPMLAAARRRDARGG
jgi:hypothetical protein